MSLSWENLGEEGFDYKTYKELCKQSSPKDFYFSVKQDNHCTYVAVIPKIFFDKNGYMWDQHMDLSHILPEDLGEEMECVWSSLRTEEEVSADMISRGFIENKSISIDL